MIALDPDEVSISWEDCDILFELQVQQFEPKASGISCSFPATVESLELEDFQAYLNEQVNVMKQISIINFVLKMMRYGM